MRRRGALRTLAFVNSRGPGEPDTRICSLALTDDGLVVRDVGLLHCLDGYELFAPDDDAYDRIIAVASGKQDYRACAGKLAQWARSEGR